MSVNATRRSRYPGPRRADQHRAIVLLMESLKGRLVRQRQGHDQFRARAPSIIATRRRNMPRWCWNGCVMADASSPSICALPVHRGAGHEIQAVVEGAAKPARPSRCRRQPWNWQPATGEMTICFASRRRSRQPVGRNPKEGHAPARLLAARRVVDFRGPSAGALMSSSGAPIPSPARGARDIRRACASTLGRHVPSR